jgi:hypothetical protein
MICDGAAVEFYSTDREAWLYRLTESLSPVFRQAGIILPAKVRIAPGWPLNRRAGKKTKSEAIGQCWARRCSADGTSEIFVSPVLDDGVEVGATLIHELIHAVDNCEHGHRGPFRKMALAVGLTGKMRATTAGPELKERLNAVIGEIGPYPHARLDADQAQGKQRTRLVKVICRRCKYAIWTTRMWLDMGTPTCVCGGQMIEVARQW